MSAQKQNNPLFRTTFLILKAGLNTEIAALRTTCLEVVKETEALEGKLKYFIKYLSTWIP